MILLSNAISCSSVHASITCGFCVVSISRGSAVSLARKSLASAGGVDAVLVGRRAFFLGAIAEQ